MKKLIALLIIIISLASFTADAQKKSLIDFTSKDLSGHAFSIADYNRITSIEAPYKDTVNFKVTYASKPYASKEKDTLVLENMEAIKFLKIGGRLIPTTAILLALTEQQLQAIWYALNMSTAEHVTITQLQALITEQIKPKK